MPGIREGWRIRAYDQVNPEPYFEIDGLSYEDFVHDFEHLTKTFPARKFVGDHVTYCITEWRKYG